MYIKTQVYSLVYICLSLFFFSLIFFLFRLSVSTFISLKSLKSHAVGLFVRSIETPSIRMRKHNRGTSNIYTAADFQHFPRSYIPHVFCIELCTIYRPHSTRHYNKKKIQKNNKKARTTIWQKTIHKIGVGQKRRKMETIENCCWWELNIKGINRRDSGSLMSAT